MEVAAQIAQVVINRVNAPQERTAELTGGVGCGLGGLGVDQVNHGLGLRQVELTVQKGAARKFSGQRLPCARGKQTLQSRRQHRGRTVALQLDRVLAGVAVRRGGADGHGLVDHAALTVAQLAQHQLVRGRGLQRKAAAQLEHPARDLGAAWAGQPQNADRAGRFARGDGGDDVAHFRFASKNSASSATRPSLKGERSSFASAKARSVLPALV